MTTTEQPRGFFFQPDISRASSAESTHKKAIGVSPHVQAMTFNSLSAEGDKLFKTGDYARAASTFSKALDFRSGDKQTLVARSRCYMMMGKSELAIKDADRVLESDKTYVRGVLQKADAHFSAGDFEIALVYCHRGGRLRPDVEEFRLGIQKAREAIDDALFGPISEAPPSLPLLDSYPPSQSHSRPFTAPEVARNQPGDSESKKNALSPNSTAPKPPSNHPGKHLPNKPLQAKPQFSSSAPSSPGGRKYLGKLYDDKRYLEQLLRGDASLKKTNQVQTLVENGLKYLDKREDFWRKQNPIDAERQMSPPQKPSSASTTDYLVRHDERAVKLLSINSNARESRTSSAPASQPSKSASTLPAVRPPGHNLQASRPKSSGTVSFTQDTFSQKSGHMADGSSDAAEVASTKDHINSVRSARSRQYCTAYIEESHHLVQALQQIEHALSGGDAEAGVMYAHELLQRYLSIRMPDKPRVISVIFHQLGRGYTDLSKFPVAVSYLERAVEIALEYNIKDGVLQYLSQLGSTYQRSGQFDQAVTVFEKKRTVAPESESPSIDLSIARCKFAAQQYDQAMQFAAKCLKWLDEKARTGALSDTSIMQLRMESHGLIGLCFKELNHPQKALSRFDQQAQLAQKLEDTASYGEALNNLAACYTTLGDAEKAAALKQQASKFAKPKPRSAKSSHIQFARNTQRALAADESFA